MLKDAELDDELVADSFFADPYPIYRKLREGSPVYWSEAWQAWVLTRYDDIAAHLRQPRVFSSHGRVGALLDQLPEPARSQVGLLRRHYSVGITHSDPPDHTRLRGLVSKSFAPALIESLRPKIAALAQSLVAQAAQSPNRRFDFMAEVAYPLPAIVIAEMLGAPASDHLLLRKWAVDVNNLHARASRPDPDVILATQAGLADFRAYLADLIAQHRRQPQNDVLSAMIAARDMGDVLSEEELVSTCVTLFVAGHETTTHSLSNGLFALLRHPDQLVLLRKNPALIPAAFEELLRYDTSVQRSARRVTQDCVIGGRQIRAGQRIVGLLGAANRDPAHFADPDRLEVTRQANKHIAFGFGVHFCLGAPLARLEAPLVLAALLAQLPHVQLDETQPLHWRRDVALRGLESLWLSY
ncbi:MAG: cytochrome P450 [Anaerolineae bacterium]|nr:cytochrome P450 [Anaerolineae bacterium]